MRPILVLPAALLMALPAWSQTDTLFTPEEAIPCQVREVGAEAVRFSYPGQDVPISLNKTRISRVKFRSGRELRFPESQGLKTVSGGLDFDNVAITQAGHEIMGLYRLGFISSVATGTTPFAGVDRVRSRAYRKLRTRAAMLGANVIYLAATSTNGNHQASVQTFQPWKATQSLITAVGYSNWIPSFDGFAKRMGEKRAFQTRTFSRIRPAGCDMKTWQEEVLFKIDRIRDENGLIVLDGALEGFEARRFRVVHYTESEFTVVFEKGRTLYNLVVPF